VTLKEMDSEAGGPDKMMLLARCRPRAVVPDACYTLRSP